MLGLKANLSPERRSIMIMDLLLQTARSIVPIYCIKLAYARLKVYVVNIQAALYRDIWEQDILSSGGYCGQVMPGL
jgi:hypothetical protein